MYFVDLTAVGNPDYRQDPTRPPYGVTNRLKVPCKELQDAIHECHRFITDNDLGGGNWSGGQVYRGFDDFPARTQHTLLGRISYSGRFQLYDETTNEFLWGKPHFHIECVNKNTGHRARMTGYPMPEDKCRIMISKITQYKWRSIELVPA